MEQVVFFIKNVFSKVALCDILSYMIGLGGLIIGGLSYYSSKRTQKPKYLIRSARFREGLFKDSGIQIRKGTDVVTDLAMSNIAIWNTGETLKREHVATKVPLHIKVADDAEILSVQKLYADEKNNVTFLLSEDRKTVKFDFDFLAKNEGFVVKVFHTAGKQRNPLQVKGALQNGLEFTLPNKRFSKISAVLSHLRLPRTLFMKAEGYFTLLMGLSIILMAFSDDKMRHLHEPFETILMILIGCSMLLMSYMLLHRRLPQKLHKAFYDEY